MTGSDNGSAMVSRGPFSRQLRLVPAVAIIAVGLLSVCLDPAAPLTHAAPGSRHATSSRSAISSTLRTLRAIPEPVTSHPRLWITAADLPKLRSWAVPTNPTYEDGMVPLLQHVLSVYRPISHPFMAPIHPKPPTRIPEIRRVTLATCRRSTG